jgi:hypothetical protein
VRRQLLEWWVVFEFEEMQVDVVVVEPDWGNKRPLPDRLDSRSAEVRIEELQMAAGRKVVERIVEESQALAAVEEAAEVDKIHLMSEMDFEQTELIEPNERKLEVGLNCIGDTVLEKVVGMMVAFEEQRVEGTVIGRQVGNRCSLTGVWEVRLM